MLLVVTDVAGRTVTRKLSAEHASYFSARLDWEPTTDLDHLSAVCWMAMEHVSGIDCDNIASAHLSDGRPVTGPIPAHVMLTD